jgi:LemA protein
MASLILLAVVVGAGLWLIGAYNGLVSLRNQTLNAFKQIDVQLKRRHDLIPNLVNAVKGAMEFERSTLESVIQARNQAIQISHSGPEAMKQIAQAENALSGALSRLMVVVEQYPQLKATGNIGQLQEELTSTENKVSFARQLYNDTATQYNTKQQQFPTNLVAGIARAQPADLWEIEDQAERAVPRVDLSSQGPSAANPALRRGAEHHPLPPSPRGGEGERG